MDSKGGHLRPPKEDAPKEDGALERRTNLPKGGRLATLRSLPEHETESLLQRRFEMQLKMSPEKRVDLAKYFFFLH